MHQDFFGQNLRGRSFKGQNLEGANFSGTDIKSADFTGANLNGANFTGAKAGLQKRWAIFLVCVSWVLSGISGFFLAFTGLFIAFIFDSPHPLNQVVGWTSLIVVIVLFIVILDQGLKSALAVTFALIVALAVAVALANTCVLALALAVTLANACALAFAGPLAVAGDFALAVANAGAGALAFVFNGLGFFAFAFLGGGTGIAASLSFAFAFLGAFVLAFVLAVAGILFSANIGRRAMEGDEKYSWIRNIAIAFAAIGGTSFRSSDLTDVNFTTATLKSTDFRKAILIRTCFNKTKKLDFVRPGTTYLQKAQVVSVLKTGVGQDSNFDRENLSGINFKGANLIDASFIGADLSQANLQDADLSRAKLVQAQLNGTDLTGANLTGAYIQDWGITTDTKFDGVRCEYVYMRLPTAYNPDPLRKPDNNKEVFAPGEFADFSKPNDTAK